MLPDYMISWKLDGFSSFRVRGIDMVELAVLMVQRVIQVGRRRLMKTASYWYILVEIPIEKLLVPHVGQYLVDLKMRQ